ncbi:chitin binding beak protein 1 [Elysia marginata]|uniref:Chitin binding beak protein 1 n=1 Tax=Elysia marginata TaxID=1093978 RepID=A0AAV4G6G6_9GAST|nr:chitin binding beak protein 1 [Elysia marginata]
MLERQPRLLWRGVGLALVYLLAFMQCPSVSPSPVSPLLQMSCHDDVTFIHSVAGSCEHYVMCYSGMTFTGTCPMFSSPSSPILQTVFLSPDNMPFSCMWNPRARVTSYTSCAQYFDCSATPSAPGALPDYVTECPYPQLFSTATGDYIQYQQLCQGPSCGQCEDRHPSCVGRPDGNHLVPPSSTVYIVCHSERTITIGRCSQGQRFSNSTRRCEQRIIPSVVTPPAAPSSKTFSSSPKTKKQSLSPSELRALFEALKNPVAVPKQKQTPRLPTAKVSIVSDPRKSILALKGEAIMVMSLNKTNSADQDNRRSFSTMIRPQLAGIVGNSRDRKSFDGSSYGGASAYPTQALTNPYSK